MAEVASPFSLYPQPPAPAAGGLLSGDPSKIVGIANALNQNALQQQQIRAGQGIEQLYNGAVGPDGTVDNALVMSRAPTLGVRAPEVVSTLQAQQGQRIANTTAQFEQSAKQNQFVLDGLGTLADKPNVTRDDVNTFVATAARNTGIPSPILNAWVRTLPPGGPALRQALVAQRNLAIGAGPTSSRVQGAPDSSGAPTQITAGQANYEGAGVGANDDVTPKSVKTETIRAPGISTALPPGETGLMEDSGKRFSALRATAGSSPQNHADLSNLLHDSRILGNIQGPTVEIEKRLNTLSQRLGVGTFSMDKGQVAAAESYDKIVSQLASNQQKQMSDAGLHIAQSMNPTLAMSTVGREGVINMLRGNQDALDRIRTEANKAKVPAGQYDRWMQDFGQKLDVRVFQFNRMNRGQQQKFLLTMDPAEVPKFEEAYKFASDKERQWVDPLKKAE